MNIRSIIAISMMVVLSACADFENDDPAVVSSRMYVSEEAPFVALLTMVNESGDYGEHSGILINASQTVLYDPAGSFRYEEELARSRDIHYGMSPRMVDYYKRYHARFGYYVVSQKIYITAEEAEALFREANRIGTTGQLRCGLSASSVLNSIPRFANIPTTYWPGKIMDAMAEVPGIETSYTRENDIGQNYVN